MVAKAMKVMKVVTAMKSMNKGKGFRVSKKPAGKKAMKVAKAMKVKHVVTAMKSMKKGKGFRVSNKKPAGKKAMKVAKAMKVKNVVTGMKSMKTGNGSNKKCEAKWFHMLHQKGDGKDSDKVGKKVLDEPEPLTKMHCELKTAGFPLIYWRSDNYALKAGDHPHLMATNAQGTNYITVNIGGKIYFDINPEMPFNVI
jgi:hypothetical protein